jgi:nucleoside-diphosphate-sugar epimerase
MNLLITGGTGFIGSAIALRLKRTGHKIAVYANTENPELMENKIDFIKGDIFDDKKLKLALRKCDAVVHAVGFPGIEAVQNNPDTSFRLNIGSLQQVLEVMRQVALKKVLFISTAAVYGRTRTSPVSETAVARPVSLYGFHKYIAEEIARSYSKYYDFHVTIARLFNAYGINENRFLKQLVGNGIKGIPVPVFGMDQIRDFMHVDDMAAAVVKLVELDSKFEIYNVGTGVGRRISDMISMVKSQVPALTITNSPSAQKTYDSVADITKIKRAIGYKPDVSDRKMKLVIAGLKKKSLVEQGHISEI